MDSNEPIYSSPKTNSHSIVSLILGILTVLALCGGMIPVPFTGFICFPSSFLFGLFALIFGFHSLNKIRKNNEGGKHMAWTGILTGGLVFLCMVLMLAAIVSLFFFAPDTIPPILPGRQIWIQSHSMPYIQFSVTILFCTGPIKIS